MKTAEKRLLALLLVLVMCVGVMSITALADGDPAIVAQGTCGATDADNVTWVLTDDGTLTISGTGDMANYMSSASRRPEYETYKDSITAVMIESGVTTVGNYAFYKYTSLQTAVMAEGVIKTGNYVFRNCSALKSITIPKSFTTFGTAAFLSSGLEIVNYGGSELDWPGFLAAQSIMNQSTLGAVTVNYLGGTVTAISLSGYKTEYFLHEWFDLTGATVTAVLSTGDQRELDPAALTFSEFDSSTPGEKTVAVSYKEVTTDITVTVRDEIGVVASGNCGVNDSGDNLTWSITSDGVLTISGVGEMYDGYGYYSDCAPWYTYADKVTSIVVGEGVKSVTVYSFYHANYPYSNITSLTLPASLESIGDAAFMNMPLPGAINIPSNIQYVGQRAFYGCTKLECLTLNSNLSNSETFYGCSLLEVVSLGENVKVIADRNFSNCTALKTINLSGIETFGSRVFENCTSLTSADISSCVSADSRVFNGCTGIETATIGATSSCMFDGCTGLAEVTVLDGVTSLPEGMFRNCSSLRVVTLPASVTTYGLDLFAGVDPMPEFRGEGGPAAEAYFNYQTDENGVVYSGDNTALISVPTTFEGELTVRNGVVNICGNAAKGCTGITAVNLPDTVQTINGNAFSGCSSLTAIAIPNGVKHIEINTFQNCSALTQVTLPDSLISIGNSAFSDCASLTSIALPEGLTTIELGAFRNCISLTEIMLPSTLKNLGSQVFWGAAIKSIVIPEGITIIQNMCFYNCTSLETVVIPFSVTRIQDMAFSSCSAMQTVYYAGGYDDFDMIAWDYPSQKQQLLNIAELSCYYGPLGDPADAPVITVQPEGKTFVQNAVATDALLVTVQAAAEGERLYLDWFSKASETATGVRIASNLSADGLTATVTPNTEAAGNTYYYCLVTKIAEDGTVTQTTSDIVCVTIRRGYRSGRHRFCRRSLSAQGPGRSGDPAAAHCRRQAVQGGLVCPDERYHSPGKLGAPGL